MTGAGAAGTLRVVFASDAPDHDEARAIIAWLGDAPGVECRSTSLDGMAPKRGEVFWIHGVHPLGMEDVGSRGGRALRQGGGLVTGGAATLAAAAGLDSVTPDLVGRATWPARDDDDGHPPLRGHATFRGHPLFEGLGRSAITWAPEPGEEYTRAVYVLPRWPASGRVVAVERSRSGIHGERATIWEHEGEDGRLLSIGAFLPLDSRNFSQRAAAERLALNGLHRVRGAPGGEVAAADAEDGTVWPSRAGGVTEDRALTMPELPLLEHPLGSLDFRLRTTGPAADDRPYSVAGRRALVRGRAGAGIEDVWAHPVRLVAGLRLRDSVAETLTVTPVGAERQLAVGGAAVLERVAVPREAPACVIEWTSRVRPVEVEIEWTCDLRLAGPYPPASQGVLRWRSAARGLVVEGDGGDRATFAFSEKPLDLEIEDASGGGRDAVRVRARVRLQPRSSLRLAIAGAAGDAAMRRALAAADRTDALPRARQARAERLLTRSLRLDAADPVAVQALEWEKQRLDARTAELPGLGRAFLADHARAGGAAATGAPGDPAVRVPGAVADALGSLAMGEPGGARDVLTFLGRHQHPAGDILLGCTTGGFTRYDPSDSAPLYLLLAARYLAWTGDIGLVRAEWPLIRRAWLRALETGSEGGTARARLLGDALAELGDAADSIGRREDVQGIRSAAATLGGKAWRGDKGLRSPILDLVHGALGAEPDAARGRLVLRPAPPSGRGRLRVRGLEVGGASIGLSYRGEADVHTFRLEQTRGAAPLQVVVEARVPGGALRDARVDGQVAELDARVVEGRVRVPVQVVLDHARELVLTVERSAQQEEIRN